MTLGRQLPKAQKVYNGVSVKNLILLIFQTYGAMQSHCPIHKMYFVVLYLIMLVL